MTCPIDAAWQQATAIKVPQAKVHVNMTALPLGCMGSVWQCTVGKLCPGLLEHALICLGIAAPSGDCAQLRLLVHLLLTMQ